MQVELNLIGEASLQYEIWHAACELPRLVGIAAEADRQLAGASVDGDALLSVCQHVGKLISEPAVADAEIVGEAERPCPFGYHVERFAKQIPQDLGRPRQQVRKDLCLRVDIRAHG